MNNDQRKTMIEEMGKLCIDTAKLIVGGVILAGIMRTDISPTKLIVFGFVFVFLFSAFGIMFVIKSKSS